MLFKARPRCLSLVLPVAMGLFDIAKDKLGEQLKTGGEEYNQRPGQSSPYDSIGNIDHSKVFQHVSDEHGSASDSGHQDMMSTALKFLNKDHRDNDIDDDDYKSDDVHRRAEEAHKALYSGNGNQEPQNPKDTGLAAAMNLMKKFTGGNDSKVNVASSNEQQVGSLFSEVLSLTNGTSKQDDSGFKEKAMKYAMKYFMENCLKNGGASSLFTGGGGGAAGSLLQQFLK